MIMKHHLPSHNLESSYSLQDQQPWPFLTYNGNHTDHIDKTISQKVPLNASVEDILHEWKPSCLDKDRVE